MVLGVDPAYVPATLGLGRALEAAGDVAGAEQIYRELGTEADAVEALARLVEPRDPQEALSLWLRLQSLRIGDPVPYREEVRLQLAVDLDAALAAWRQYTALLLGAAPDATVCLALSAALDAAGRGAEAEVLLREWIEAFPEGEGAPGVRARLERIEVERAADALALGGSTPLTPAQTERLRAGTARLRAGEHAAAEATARALVGESPRAAAARAFYADVLLAQGDWAGSEAQAVLARTLAPDDPSHHILLAQILESGYAGRRRGEAVAELREAAALRPGDPEVALRLARLELEHGEWDAARASFERFLTLKPTGEDADGVRATLDALGRQPPPPILLPEADVPRLPEPAGHHFRVALVYFSRGRTADALVELRAARALLPDAPDLLNLEARILRRQGDVAGATAALDRSLAVAPDQGPVLLARGEIAAADGDLDLARRSYARAAEAGEADAHYLLARLAADAGDWETARVELDAWSRTAGGESLHAPSSAGLREELRRHELRTRTVPLLLGIAAALVPLGWWFRRRSTVTLDGLLRRHPALGHEVAAHLAALRHEALKHRATVLPDVADALERGDRGPWEGWLVDAPLVRTRFDATVAAIEALGRRQGVRLDLRATDPVLAPMHRALRRAMGPRPPSPATLRACSSALNEVGYAALGRVIHALSVFRVDEELVRRVHARVCGEPGIVGTELPELEVTGEGGAVGLFATDLEDILANLLRNALTAGATSLAVRLGRSTDPITGLGAVEIAVEDDAPGLLTDAMIRGRSISRGLGLALELAARHGGSIHVRPVGADHKAVVVALPAVEAARAEVEWSA